MHCAGVGALEDISGNSLESGTWNGGVTIINQTVTEESVVKKVWDEQRAGHQVAGSMGEAIAGIPRALGLLHENTFVDNTMYDGNHNMTTCRVRSFDSEANVSAATDGGSETTGLVATYIVEAGYTDVEMDFYRMTKV